MVVWSHLEHRTSRHLPVDGERTPVGEKSLRPRFPVGPRLLLSSKRLATSVLDRRPSCQDVNLGPL